MLTCPGTSSHSRDDCVSAEYDARASEACAVCFSWRHFCRRLSTRSCAIDNGNQVSWKGCCRLRSCACASR